MKKIGLMEFAELLSEDPVLREKVRACPEAEAPRLLEQLAAERGYVLDRPAMEALADDDLSAVSGGRNPFAEPNGGELNPYSWFVMLMRILFGRDGDEDPDGTDGAGGASRRPL